MRKHLFLVAFSLVLGIGVVGVGSALTVVAQTAGESVEERRQRLRNELEDVQAQIQKQQTLLRQKQKERVSVERDLAIINGEIQEARLQIRKHNIRIQQLQRGINNKTSTINTLEGKLERRKGHVAELIRQTDHVDDFTMVEIMLSNKNLSEFFEEVDEFDEIKNELHASFETIRSTQQRTRKEKKQLDTKQAAVIDAKQEIEAQKQRIEKKQAEKEHLLAIKRSEEQSYEQVLEQKKKRAAEIRTALFALRDTAAIPFGKAYRYAKEAQRSTGVRPAFLLAILKQESNLGENVGTCNRPGDAQNWQDIMPGPNDNSWRNDHSAYLKITSALGLNPDTMPLSCPWQGGWGGAMGPSQFIPTTWLQYADRVGNYIGVDMPNPWEPRHAFMASASYLADLGAANGGYTAEKRAALKYYAGSNWHLAKNQFYGNQVMKHAQNIQTTMIDPLEEVSN